ncbi:MAG: polysaccharide biosynthesis/export family protein [Pyrinomonadaceae bacterium]
MKAVNLIHYIALILIFASAIAAQETSPSPQPREQLSKVETETKTKENSTEAEPKLAPETLPTPTPAQEDKKDDAKPAPKTISAQTALPDATKEEKEILPYYKNYLDKYTLGPTDVISVEVFGQCPNYCKSNITVPPTGKISYPLIKGGVFVAGRTIEEVEDEIKSKLNEYIIDPNVTVTLDKAMSVRYSVLGKVTAPGVRVMERRMTIYEAIVEAGGITKEGNQKKVVLYRYDPKGNLTSQLVNLEAIERGKAPMIELQAGDQVFVADKGFQLNMTTVFDVLSKASIVRLLFGSPF